MARFIRAIQFLKKWITRMARSGSVRTGDDGLKTVTAMAAGVTGRVWDMNDVAALIAEHEAPVSKRGPDKKKAA